MELFDEEYLNEVAKPLKNNFEGCLGFALDYLPTASAPFSAETIAMQFEKAGGIKPEEPRVWGAVIKSLSRQKLIQFHSWGTYEGKQGHGHPVRNWVKAN